MVKKAHEGLGDVVPGRGAVPSRGAVPDIPDDAVPDGSLDLPQFRNCFDWW